MARSSGTTCSCSRSEHGRGQRWRTRSRSAGRKTVPPSPPSSLTFRGAQDGPALTALLEEGVAGQVRSVVFALPVEARWPLPLYELALLTGIYLTDRGAMGEAMLARDARRRAARALRRPGKRCDPRPSRSPRDRAAPAHRTDAV